MLVMAPKSQGTLQVNDCLSAITDIPGCFQEVITSFLTFQIKIGPECCKALLDIEDNCWRTLFPLITSQFPSLVKTFCTTSPPPHPHNLQSLSADYSTFSPEPAWAPEGDTANEPAWAPEEDTANEPAWAPEENTVADQ